MSDGEVTGNPKPPAEKRFLVLFHQSKRKQAVEHWNGFVAALHQGRHLIGGSALAKPSAVKEGAPVPPRCTSVGGYMVITAPSIAKVRALMKQSPTHRCGGLVDIFPLVVD